MKGINCSKCSSSVHWLEIFSGNLCLDCYRVSDQANRDITADEIVYGYEDCFDCHTKANQFKGIGLEVGTVNGKMYYQCSNCDFLQVG